MGGEASAPFLIILQGVGPDGTEIAEAAGRPPAERNADFIDVRAPIPPRTFATQDGKQQIFDLLIGYCWLQ
jgi:hypothetical protein